MDPQAREAYALFYLLTDWTWIHRRVERVDITSDASVTHFVSIDFTLPKLPTGVATKYVPLGFQRKSILRHFSLRDETDRPLFLLNGTDTASLI